MICDNHTGTRRCRDAGGFLSGDRLGRSWTLVGVPLVASPTSRALSTSYATMRTDGDEGRPQGSKTSPGGRLKGIHPRPYRRARVAPLQRIPVLFDDDGGDFALGGYSVEQVVA